MQTKPNKKITVRFSKRLKMAMQVSLIQSGYGLHGKSKWLKEAMRHFLRQAEFVDTVKQGVDINQAELTEIEAFYLDAEMIHSMRNASITVRAKYPLFEGVQSALIRAAVIQHLGLQTYFPRKKNS